MMSQQEFNRNYENAQIRQQNEEIIRRELRAAEHRGIARAQNGHVFGTTLAVLAASLWFVAVVGLYDVLVANVTLLDPVVDRVPDDWLRPGWWGTVLKLVVAVSVALPLFVAAFVLKKVRTAVGYRFVHSWWATLPLWTWMVVLTTLRAVVDLFGIVVAWVMFRLLSGVEVMPVSDLGNEALWGALLFIVPAAVVRAFVLTSQVRAAEYA